MTPVPAPGKKTKADPFWDRVVEAYNQVMLSNNPTAFISINHENGVHQAGVRKHNGDCIIVIREQ